MVDAADAGSRDVETAAAMATEPDDDPTTSERVRAADAVAAIVPPEVRLEGARVAKSVAATRTVAADVATASLRFRARSPPITGHDPLLAA